MVERQKLGEQKPKEYKQLAMQTMSVIKNACEDIDDIQKVIQLEDERSVTLFYDGVSANLTVKYPHRKIEGIEYEISRSGEVRKLGDVIQPPVGIEELKLIAGLSQNPTDLNIFNKLLQN